MPVYHVRIIDTRYSKPYPVVIGKSVAVEAGSIARRYAGLDPAKCMLVYQEGVERYTSRVYEGLHALCRDIHVYKLPDSEEAKNIDTVLALIRKLHELNYSRRDLLVVLGGGAASDAAGFAAAIYKRGVPYASLPTTLLSMVDAAIGGKVAVNYSGIKNVLGAFYQPRLVIEDLEFLETLPRLEILSGIGELVKYAYTLSERLHELLWRHREGLVGDNEALVEAVVEGVEAKARIVEMDEREEYGVREILNFGHTFGHALEASTGVKHGIAVAWGCVVEAWAGVRLGFTRETVAEELEKLVEMLGFPKPRLPAFEDIEARMRRDKKVYGDVIRAVFTLGPGRGLVAEVGLDEYVRAVEWAARRVWEHG